MNIFEAKILLRIVYDDRAVRVTTLALCAAVLLVIGVYAATAGYPPSSLASKIHGEIGLSRDKSMGEVVNYGVAFLASVLFFLVFIESRSWMYFFFSVLMAFVWFDDAGRYHERFGVFLAETYSLPVFPATRLRDTGELIAWALAALVLAPIFLIALIRRRPGDVGALMLVSVGFLAIVFFGVFVDIIHVAAPTSFENFLGIVEDGGEMLSVVFIAGTAMGLARNFESYSVSVGQIVCEKQPEILNVKI